MVTQPGSTAKLLHCPIGWLGRRRWVCDVHIEGRRPWIGTQPRSNRDWRSSKVLVVVGHVTEWRPHPFNQTRHLYWLETWKMKHNCFHFHTCAAPRPLPLKPPSNRNQPHTSHHSGILAWGRKSGWKPMPSCGRTGTELDWVEQRLSDLPTFDLSSAATGVNIRLLLASLWWVQWLY